MKGKDDTIQILRFQNDPNQGFHMRILEKVLNTTPISRIRRNHGLEHATIHILSQKFPKSSIAGHSDVGGFWLLGELNGDDIQIAAEQALMRMRGGEHNLAVHPNCGTNFVTAGIAAGVAGTFAMLGAGRRWQDKIYRLPLAMSLATLALIFAQPLGFLFQERVTTSGQPGELEIVDVIPTKRGRFKAHRVVTRG